MDNQAQWWIRVLFGGRTAGCRWVGSKVGWYIWSFFVYKPAVIPQSLTPEPQRSYKNIELDRSGGKAGKSLIKYGMSLVSYLWMMVYKSVIFDISGVAENSYPLMHTHSNSSSIYDNGYY